MSDGSPAEKVPVLRPQLPTREAFMPYLEMIDSSRMYSNWGPLTVELERRLTAELGLQPQMAVTAASGTSALVGAILAVAGHASRERPLAVFPPTRSREPPPRFGNAATSWNSLTSSPGAGRSIPIALRATRGSISGGGGARRAVRASRRPGSVGSVHGPHRHPGRD